MCFPVRQDLLVPLRPRDDPFCFSLALLCDVIFQSLLKASCLSCLSTALIMSSHSNAHRFSFRTYDSSNMLPCRKCGRVFLTALALINHYHSHENEAYLYQRANSLRDISVNNRSSHHRLSPSSVSQQRYHPYLSNYRDLPQQPRERGLVASNSPFLASAQNQNLLQVGNRSVTNRDTFPVSAQNHIPISGRTSAARTGQFDFNQTRHGWQAEVYPFMRRNRPSLPRWLLDPMPKPAVKIVDKGFDESEHVGDSTSESTE